jgi:outer membrane receptor protein involved in Fe transport
MPGVLALLLSIAVSATPATSNTPDSKVDGTGAPASVPAASETILVTATRSERALSELPVSATVVTAEEIRTAPVLSVDDLLRAIPGVTPSVVSSSGSTPNNQRFSMHGLGGTRALVLLDGIPLHDPYSGIVQWQNVPLRSLRQIEVVRGGNASLFGNFALGGTVNLISRPIDESRADLDVSYGSNASKRAAAGVDYVVTPALSLRLSHHQRDSDGFVRVPDPGPIDQNAWVEDSITSARADIHTSGGTSVILNANTSRIDISQGTRSTFSKRDINAFSAALHRAVGPRGLLSANAFTQRQSEHLVNSLVIGQREDEYVSQEGTTPSSGSGASVEYSLQRSGRVPFFSIGVDVQQSEATEDRTSFSRAGAVTQVERVGGRQRFAGLFAQASWRPSDRIEVLGSGRVDYFRSDDGADIIAGGTSTLYPATSSTQFDPRISVRYALRGRSALRASVYRAFNAPTLRDLYRNNQSGNSIILGNPYLEPETLVGGEAGWEWAGSNSRLEVTLYRSVIDGLQSRVNVDGQRNLFRNMNLGTSRNQGVEVAADVRLSPRWLLVAGYTYAEGIITDDPNPELIGNWLIEVPGQYGSLTVRYRGDRGTVVEARGRSVGRSYGDTSNIAVTPAHRVVDFSATHPMRPWMDAYVLVENVFDENYYMALAATSFRRGLPRTVTAGVRLTRSLPGRR